MPFQTDLPRTLADMREARDALAALAAPLSAADMQRAQPGGWTAARVLQHVIESEAIYAKLLAHQCGRAAPDGAAGDPSATGAAAAEQLSATRAAVLHVIDAIDEGAFYRLVTFGHEEYSARSVLENIAAHDRDHYGQIAALAAGAALERRAQPSPAAPPTPTDSSVRTARPDDLPRITEIYNHYVRTSPATFDLEPFTVSERHEWFSHYKPDGPHRLLVATDHRAGVTGYASSGQFRTKPAYDITVETTVYCAPEALGRAVGTRLYAALFEALRTEDLRMAVAAITLPNPASIALHERFGFRQAGLMHGIGRKFGRQWDVAWYEKPLPHP